MRKIYLLLLMLVTGMIANSQTNIANYTLTKSIGTYTPITGGTVFIAANVAYDNEISSAITIPSFTFGGTAQTTLYISANGFVTFGAAAAATNYTPLSTLGTTTGAIAAFGRDLGWASTSTPGATSEIRYELVGSEFVIQFQDVKRYAVALERLTAQIRLNIATNEIKIVYGPNAVAGNSTTYSQVGIRGNSVTWASNVNNIKFADVPVGTTCTWADAATGEANSATMFYNSTNPTAIPADGLTFTWAPPLAAIPPVRTFANVTGISTTGATLPWTAVAGTTGYNVQYRTVNSCAWTNWSGNPVATNTVSLTGLNPNTTYQVRVQSTDGTNNSIWSHIPSATAGDGYVAAGTFTTLALPCVTPTAQPTVLNLTGGYTSVIASFTAASPVSDKYLVVRTPGLAPLSVNPANTTTYTAGGTLGNGTIVAYNALTSFVNTGLTPNTTYTYTIFAANDACAGGPVYNTASPLTGSVSTSATAAAYTWNATSGSADAAIASNWTPARNTPDVSDTLYFSNGGSSTITNLTTSTVAKVGVKNNTTIILNSSAASQTITISKILDIAAGSTMDISSANATNSLTVTFTAANSATASIAGTLKSSGTAATTYTATNATTTVSATGVIDVSNVGVITGGTITNLIFASGANYNHARDAGTVPTALYDANSTVNITGTIATMSVIAAKVGNLVYNAPAQTVAGTWSSTLDTVRGSFTVISTGSGRIELGNNPDVQVAGNFNLNGGTLAVGNYTSGVGLLEVIGATNLNGGTLLLNSNTATGAAYTFRANGSFTQAASNTISRLNGFATAVGTILFNGTTSQAVAFNGTITNNISYTINNAAGVVLTGVVPVNQFAINTITSGAYSGSGSFAYNTTSSNLQYNGTANQTATAFEYPTVNAPTNLRIAKTAGTFVTLPNNVIVRDTLVMTSGDINLSTYNLTLGTSASAVGVLSWTAGSIRVTTGTLTRWFGTSGLPTVATNTSTGYFPLAFGTSNRNATVYFSTATALSTGGSVTLSHVNVLGNSAVTIADGAYTINKRTNSYWNISQSGLVATGTLGLRLTGGDLVVSSTPANLRLTQSASIVGTHSAGTGTNPNYQVNRTGLSVSDISTDHYIGASNADFTTVFVSINSGVWSDGLTWDAGTAPGSGDIVSISTGTTVATDAANAASQVTVQNGGVLSIPNNALTIATTLVNNGTVSVSGGTLNVTGGSATGIINNASGIINVTSGVANLGPAGGGNRLLSSAGTLSVSGGTLNVNGGITFGTAGYTFNMTSGAINIDPNDGTVGGSVASQGSLYFSAIGTHNVTGGAINFLDPCYSTTATSAYTIGYSTPTGANNDAAWGTGCIVTLGGGSNVNASSTIGYHIDCNISQGTLEVGNLVVADGRYASRRHMTVTSSSADITKIKNLTVNAGAEIVQTTANGVLAVTGNLVNNGVIVIGNTTANRGLVLCGDVQYSAAIIFSNGATSQSITGSGFFKRTAAEADPASQALNTVSTFAFYNDAVSGGLTLGMPLKAFTSVQFGGGKLNTTATNILTIGDGPTSTTAGSIYTGTGSTSTVATATSNANWGTNGWVNGPLARWVPATVTTGQVGLLPVGSATIATPALVLFSAAPSAAGTLTAQFMATDPGTNGLPLVENTINLNQRSTEGYWSVASTVTGGTYSTEFTGTGFVIGGAAGEARIVKRAISTDPWALQGTHVASSGVVVKRSGLSGFSEFGVAYYDAALPVTLTTFTGSRANNINKLSWTTLTEANNAGFELQRSTDGVNFSKVSFVASRAVNGNSSASLNYSFSDILPLKGNNYYRLNQVDKNGKSTLSNIVVLKGDKVSVVSIASAYPNPAKNNLTVKIASPSAEKLNVVITDMSGKVLAQQALSAVIGDNIMNLNVSNLASGVYFIKVIAAGNTSTAYKFIKD